ncbi:MAG: hypothetical protein ACFFBP_21695 [Promethearchaeota archaeon]
MNFDSQAKFIPKSSFIYEALSYNEINISKTSIYQHFETINIKVDVSKYDPVENHTEVQLSDLYGHTERYNMTRINDQVFSFNYTTNIQSQLLDFINVSFLVYNESRDLLNAHTRSKNFTINPNCRITFVPDSNYHKEEFLYADVMPDLYSASQYGWDTWNISIDEDLDGTNGNDLFSIPGYNQSSILFEINSTFNKVNKDYCVRVNLINSTNQIITSSCYTFTVENSNPTIAASTVTLNSSSIFRSNVDNCLIELNASDLEREPKFLNVSLLLKHLNFETYDCGYLNNKQDGSFQLAFNAPHYLTPGNWEIKLTVIDNQGGSYEYTHGTQLTIKNNAPKIYGYEINGIPMTQGISIYYGQTISFTFNVSDEEDGNVLNITVILISSNNDIIERTAGPDLTITFSSYELVSGIWYVYVYIEDSDGAIVGFEDDIDKAPLAIRIISDLIGPVLPWIALVIGLIIGVLIGAGIGYYRIRSKILEGQDIKFKKKIKTEKIATPDKKLGKEPTKPSDADVKKKKIDEKEEKAEPSKTRPQRKIKRKL